jgi:glutaconate CoA-transferase subunit B
MLTDLCIFEPDALSKEMVVTSIHPGVTREQIQENTGWAVRYSAAVETTVPPSSAELAALRDLQERTRQAHASA